MKEFTLIVSGRWKALRFQVIPMPSDRDFEYYKITVSNNEIVLKNNAPILRRDHIDHKIPTWHIHSGKIHNLTIKRNIIKALNIILGYKAGVK